ncbi:MAG: hypothetical protein NTW25_00295 [Candidatus Kapabacteria bacterium]|nr:hypothetical protein [Candidatus Kapabacteria bacterium]
MGVNVSNIGGGRDFSTNEFFIEFHRKLILKEDEYNNVIEMLSKKKYEDAKSLLKSNCPKNSHHTIDMFLDDLKDIHSLL